MEKKMLTIEDPITEKTYQLTVNDADFNRAHEDIEFATILLQRAINNEMEAEKENCTLDDETMSQELDGSDTQQVGKHCWKYSETVALIKSMSTHFENLTHVKKRKHVFENIANDLLSIGIHCNAIMCQTKWKSLVRSYGQAKDNQTKTGRGPSRFQFFEEMDSILGTKPTSQCKHTLDSINMTHSIVAVVDPNSDGNAENEHVRDTAKDDVNNNATEQQVPKVEKKRNRVKEQIANEREENKNKRHQKRLEIEKIKIDVEKQKIELLKKYLEHKEREADS